MGKTLMILVGGDLLIALMAHHFGFMVRSGTLSLLEDNYLGDILKVLVFALVLLFTTYFSEMYSREKRFGLSETLGRVLASLVLAFVVLSATYYLQPSIAIRTDVLILSLILFGIVQFLWHNRYPLLLRVPGISKKVLVFGVGPLAQQMEMLISMSNTGYVFEGFVSPGRDYDPDSRDPLIASVDTLLAAAENRKVNKIVISLSERRGVFPVREILRCKLKGIEIVDAVTFYEDVTGKLMVENINPSWFIFSGGFKLTQFMRGMKRILDVILSLMGIILFLPFAPIIAVMIKLDSPGPVLFKQLRVGVGEKTFHLYKFRTMRQDAEKNSGAVWATEDDPRITRVGRFLRKSRLDEVPQLFNVLRGDMSFVGPRPERPEFVNKLNERVPYYATRHTVKPGVTGWAQVKYPYGASEEDALEKLRYDLFYIKNYSLLLDLVIILETVKVVLFGRGGR
ncbi:TIGR03013 family PEP-CTERM/XrtA system glycosyltransferase [Desulfuromonas sp. KJ2020]|uniref:TIGR03013 family XrtA/PEP-CTERM system glycosyltransferase n=1 Tax=Desulfuromonas sp. KJ2020 TaxID=2919173 RepID=UPI0020A8064D|nr:TIGR03013 family XrtA/PEP-CTERM system glycosyltransferase [Desulfuromonas sp. KJ2020]MCP3178159.1 TIGR03013 family PEP-CTERM/XrtA system glycosyltransferase [Desulfuromonas sp. KJ2020]